MKTNSIVKIDAIESKAVIKVEKIFNALKKDSVLKVKRKLEELNFLKIGGEECSMISNPQTDNSDSTYQSKMEIISESTPTALETPTKTGSYNQPTSSFSIRKSKVDQQIRQRKDYMHDAKVEQRKARIDGKHKEKLDETELTKLAFIECYRKEFHKRRENFLEQKAKKDELFREIEQLKTSKRLIENKISKSKKTTASSQFPMRVEVSLPRAIINDKKEIDEKKSETGQLGVSFKITQSLTQSTGFTSIIVNDVREPKWTDVIPISIMSDGEIIFFQILLNDVNTETVRMLDSFDLRGSEIANSFDSTKTFKDIITTGNGNEFSLFIKKKGDEYTKLKSIEKKIEKKSAMYSRLNQLHALARDSMENLINKKGMDLIKEWGFMSK